MIKAANSFLFLGGIANAIASLIHLGCIFGGPTWYRFFGAGEKMAQMAERGQWYPAIITIFIATILLLWSFYGFSGAGIFPRLPFMRFCLVGISAVFLIRGFMPFLIMPYFAHISGTFWIISSAICAIIGIFYAIGTWQMWALLAQK